MILSLYTHILVDKSLRDFNITAKNVVHAMKEGEQTKAFGSHSPAFGDMY
jgi:hypothetical protein